MAECSSYVFVEEKSTRNEHRFFLHGLCNDSFTNCNTFDVASLKGSHSVGKSLVWLIISDDKSFSSRQSSFITQAK